MNLTNDFVSTLINNREKIVDKLEQNYSYDHLINIFSEINSEKDMTIKILPMEKILYRIMTGQFDASRYSRSSIDWIPSEELVEAIILIAKKYDIKHIEELYSGLGLLSALLAKKESEIIITAADTFNNSNTCDKLNLYPIAKRNATDYKYYPLLNESYPDMVISTYFPDTSSNSENIFFSEISKLIYDMNHKIIMIILPNTFTMFYELLYYASMSDMYDIQTHHIKAVSKYHYVTDLLKKYYKSSMIAHILIRSDVLSINIEKTNSLLSQAIIPTKNIDTQCSLKKILQCCYDSLSPKFVKNIYRTFDHHGANNEKITVLTDCLISIKKINTPQYIYDMDELLFWIELVRQGLYFLFDRREDFFNFYTITKSMESSEIRRNNNFPYWIKTIDKIYAYLYLGIVSSKQEWRKNLYIFNSEFNKINIENKNMLVKKSP